MIKTECLTSSSTGNCAVKVISEKLNNNLPTKRNTTTRMGFNTEERIRQRQAPDKHPIAEQKRRGNFFLPWEIWPHPLVSSHFTSLNNRTCAQCLSNWRIPKNFTSDLANYSTIFTLSFPSRLKIDWNWQAFPFGFQCSMAISLGHCFYIFVLL